MEEVIRLEPSTSGCSTTSCGTIPMCSMAAQYVILTVFIFFSIFIIGMIYSKRIGFLKTQNMSQTTWKLNLMLMRALIVHIGIIGVLLVIPLIMFMAIAMFGNETNNTVLEVIMLVFTCHSLFDIPAMLFFIKPYRKFIAEILWNALRKVGLDKFLQNDQVIVVKQFGTQVQSSTGIISIQNRS